MTTPTNLETLLVAIREGRYSDQEMSDLPTFGGVDGPADTNGVWSWDATRLLCRTSRSEHQDGLGIVTRPMPTRYLLESKTDYCGWEVEGSGDTYATEAEAESAARTMRREWPTNDDDMTLEYRVVEVGA